MGYFDKWVGIQITVEGVHMTVKVVHKTVKAIPLIGTGSFYTNYGHDIFSYELSNFFTLKIQHFSTYS